MVLLLFVVVVVKLLFLEAMNRCFEVEILFLRCFIIRVVFKLLLLLFGGQVWFFTANLVYHLFQHLGCCNCCLVVVAVVLK